MPSTTSITPNFGDNNTSILKDNSSMSNIAEGNSLPSNISKSASGMKDSQHGFQPSNSSTGMNLNGNSNATGSVENIGSMGLGMAINTNIDGPMHQTGYPNPMYNMGGMMLMGGINMNGPGPAHFSPSYDRPLTATLNLSNHGHSMNGMNSGNTMYPNPSMGGMNETPLSQIDPLKNIGTINSDMSSPTMPESSLNGMMINDLSISNYIFTHPGNVNGMNMNMNMMNNGSMNHLSVGLPGMTGMNQMSQPGPNFNPFLMVGNNMNNMSNMGQMNNNMNNMGQMHALNGMSIPIISEGLNNSMNSMNGMEMTMMNTHSLSPGVVGPNGIKYSHSQSGTLPAMSSMSSISSISPSMATNGSDAGMDVSKSVSQGTSVDMVSRAASTTSMSNLAGGSDHSGYINVNVLGNLVNTTSTISGSGSGSNPNSGNVSNSKLTSGMQSPANGSLIFPTSMNMNMGMNMGMGMGTGMNNNMNMGMGMNTASLPLGLGDDSIDSYVHNIITHNAIETIVTPELSYFFGVNIISLLLSLESLFKTVSAVVDRAKNTVDGRVSTDLNDSLKKFLEVYGLAITSRSLSVSEKAELREMFTITANTTNKAGKAEMNASISGFTNQHFELLKQHCYNEAFVHALNRTVPQLSSSVGILSFYLWNQNSVKAFSEMVESANSLLSGLAYAVQIISVFMDSVVIPSNLIHSVASSRDLQTGDIVPLTTTYHNFKSISTALSYAEQKPAALLLSDCISFELMSCELMAQDIIANLRAVVALRSQELPRPRLVDVTLAKLHSCGFQVPAYTNFSLNSMIHNLLRGGNNQFSSESQLQYQYQQQIWKKYAYLYHQAHAQSQSQSQIVSSGVAQDRAVAMAQKLKVHASGLTDNANVNASATSMSMSKSTSGFTSSHASVQRSTLSMGSSAISPTMTSTSLQAQTISNSQSASNPNSNSGLTGGNGNGTGNGNSSTQSNQNTTTLSTSQSLPAVSASTSSKSTGASSSFFTKNSPTGGALSATQSPSSPTLTTNNAMNGSGNLSVSGMSLSTVGSQSTTTSAVCTPSVGHQDIVSTYVAPTIPIPVRNISFSIEYADRSQPVRDMRSDTTVNELRRWLKSRNSDFRDSNEIVFSKHTGSKVLWENMSLKDHLTLHELSIEDEDVIYAHSEKVALTLEECKYKGFCKLYKCIYVHPKSRQPDCPLGDRCTSSVCAKQKIHPDSLEKSGKATDCKYGVRCRIVNCRYKHPKERSHYQDN